MKANKLLNLLGPHFDKTHARLNYLGDLLQSLEQQHIRIRSKYDFLGRCTNQGGYASPIFSQPFCYTWEPQSPGLGPGFGKLELRNSDWREESATSPVLMLLAPRHLNTRYDPSVAGRHVRNAPDATEMNEVLRSNKMESD